MDIFWNYTLLKQACQCQHKLVTMLERKEGNEIFGADIGQITQEGDSLFLAWRGQWGRRVT